MAAPGVGKSAVALIMALRAGIPTLIISADTDRNDQGERAMAILSGASMDEIKEEPEKYLHFLAGLPPTLRFEFDSGPTAADLVEMCKAYRMVQGFYPHLIIVDTLGKVWSETGDENSRNKDAVDKLQFMARKTGAHVLACHHAVKMFDAGNVPIPLDGLMSGTSKLPEQILSMWRDDQGNVCFCPVKNRSGPADPTAMQMRSWAKMNLASMTIGETPTMEWRYEDDPELA